MESKAASASFFQNRVYMITGAGSGLGRASAQALFKAGASLCLFDIDPEGLEQTHARLEADSMESRVRVFCGNVGDENDVKQAIAQTVESFSKLDGAFNNAGVEGPSLPLHELKATEFDQVMQVNLRGVFLCLKHQLLALQPLGEGSIVNTSSIFGQVASSLSPAYAAAKHGVIGLTKAASLSAAPFGVRVNAVCPGFADTPMVDRITAKNPSMRARMERKHPLGRLVYPEEVASTVTWLLSDASSFVTGAAISVDGGYTAQ